MNKREGVFFLFTIVKEIQHSFTRSVIFFTQKDYARNIFNTYKNMHIALQQQEPPEKVADIVCSFHIEWLEVVQEVEMFSRKIKDTPREAIDTALEYTIDCTELRYDLTMQYIKKMRSTMTEEENQLMQIDLAILEDLKEVVNNALEEKAQYIRTQVDQTKYIAKITDEIEELLYWLDRLNDGLATEFCKVLHFKIPLTPGTLRKTLKQIIDELAGSSSSEAQLITKQLQVKSRVITSSERMDEINDIQITKVTEKIRALETRMSRLRVEESPALIALKYKTTFMEDRLTSLQNVKKSVKLVIEDFREQAEDENLNEYNPMNIFNHLLPHQYRCRLVDQLIRAWINSLTEKLEEHESIIEILSVVNVKEVYSDEMGNFTVDTYGRKIYTVGNDEILYQLNEHNNLVPLKDDEKHVYFYDACGRYYIDGTRERVYKTHDASSEYMLDKHGRVVKVFEIRDGVEYFYDSLGRYYINEDGLHIYRDEGSDTEYMADGLGGIIKVHKESLKYALCPIEPITMEENKYLKREVGEALKKCIAEVVIHQPLDPIAYLADLLTKYSNNIKAHEKHLKDEQERFELSQLIPRTKENSIKAYDVDDEATDINFINYSGTTDLSLKSI